LMLGAVKDAEAATSCLPSAKVVGLSRYGGRRVYWDGSKSSSVSMGAPMSGLVG